MWDFLDTFFGAADAFGDIGNIGADALASSASAAADAGGGFWDAAGNWISDNSGSLIRGVSTLAGGLLSQNANNAAAGRAADATLRAAGINAAEAARARAELEAAKQRGIAAIRAGTAGYEETIRPLMMERPVMLPTYRGLTAPQRIAREDLIRQGQSTLATSGLRGAGRAGVAALMDQDRRFVADATARNDADRLAAMRTARVAADNARSGLAQVRAQEGGSIANTEIGVGNQMANSIQRAGDVTADATTRAGLFQANAGLANAGILNDAIGTIGSVIAGALKDNNRDRYSSTGGLV